MTFHPPDEMSTNPSFNRSDRCSNSILSNKRHHHTAALDPLSHSQRQKPALAAQTLPRSLGDAGESRSQRARAGAARTARGAGDHLATGQLEEGCWGCVEQLEIRSPQQSNAGFSAPPSPQLAHGSWFKQTGRWMRLPSRADRRRQKSKWLNIDRNI